MTSASPVLKRTCCRRAARGARSWFAKCCCQARSFTIRDSPVSTKRPPSGLQFEGTHHDRGRALQKRPVSFVHERTVVPGQCRPEAGWRPLRVVGPSHAIALTIEPNAADGVKAVVSRKSHMYLHGIRRERVGLVGALQAMIGPCRLMVPPDNRRPFDLVQLGNRHSTSRM